MAAVSPARANTLLLGVMSFGLLLLMAASVRGGVAGAAVAGAAGTASAPIVSAERSITRILLNVIHFFRDIDADERENVKLRREVARLGAELARAGERGQENARLRRLLGMREDLVPRSVGGSVVTSRLAGQSRVILVDRGGSDGVRPDMAVVAWGGAVGRVVSVERDFARVRLLTDPNSGAAGVIVRSRVEGMAVGRGGDPMEMLYVPKYADVVVGDRVVTSGLDGVFPRGFGLGRVTVVGAPVGASKTIRLEPEVDDRSIEDVLILLEPAGTRLLAPEEPESAP
ncbi:MAG TPA: rod shape-determining protein MreC [Candidatus Polarisedimenticolaceae bacterium]|nr:rod shape-determining protein MreC [Candidatus Polarisedimenticolaceae bacterium]